MLDAILNDIIVMRCAALCRDMPQLFADMSIMARYARYDAMRAVPLLSLLKISAMPALDGAASCKDECSVFGYDAYAELLT